MNTKVSFLLKILKFAELGAAELQLQKEISSAETNSLADQFSIGKIYLLYSDSAVILIILLVIFIVMLVIIYWY